MEKFFKKKDGMSYKEYCEYLNKQVLKVFAIIIAFTLIIGIVIGIAIPDGKEYVYQTGEETVTVEPGDSIWPLTMKYCPNHMNSDDWIALIEDYNELSDTNIHPGWVLAIPIFEKEK